jgi:hypothetical protein
MLTRRVFVGSALASLAACGYRPPADAAVPDGIWTWFNDPRAIIHQGQLVIGSVSSRGIVQVTVGGLTRPIADLGEVDDHDNPGLLSLPDGRLAVFYSRHNDRQGLRYRVGGGPERIIPGDRLTYAKPFLVEGVVRVFSRVGGRNGEHRMASSRDLRSWTVETVFENEGHRPYVICCQDGRRIHFLLTDGHPNELHSRLFYAYMEGGRFYRADGVEVTSRQVRDFSPIGPNHAWNWQIRCFDGRPEILSTRYPGIEYWHHRLEGGRWTGARLAAGQPYLYEAQLHYAGGLCFAGPNRVILSLNEGGRYELSEWSIAPLRRVRQITLRSAHHNIRPYVVGGHLLWVAGDYEAYTDFRTSIRGARIA